jgi:hypothetical protein
MSAIVNKDVLSYYYDFKREYCIICFQNVNKSSSKNTMIAPCGCSLCSKSCTIKYLLSLFDPYYNKLSKGIIELKLEIVCICLYKFKLKTLQDLISSLIYYNIEECLVHYFVKIISEYELEVYREYCFSCMEILNVDNYK